MDMSLTVLAELTRQLSAAKNRKPNESANATGPSSRQTSTLPSTSDSSNSSSSEKRAIPPDLNRPNDRS